MNDRADARQIPRRARAVLLAAFIGCACAPIAGAAETPAPDAKDYFSGARGLPITGPMGRCLAADDPAQAAVTADCDGGAKQDWKFVGGALRLEASQACLTANPDGTAKLAPCTPARNQLWAYTVRDAAASSAWKNADLYGQIHPLDDPGRCLAVAADPFKTPALQRNPARVVDCLSVAPRQMSWFVPTQVTTIRVALARYTEGKTAEQSDAAAKAGFAALVTQVSAQFRRLGVRFVFDPDRDFRRVAAPAAADALAKLAADDLYRRIVFVATDRAISGESGAPYVEYDPAAMVDPVSGQKVDASRWSADPDRVFDKAGLPALAPFIEQRGEISAEPSAVARAVGAFADYLGLARGDRKSTRLNSSHRR